MFLLCILSWFSLVYLISNRLHRLSLVSLYVHLIYHSSIYFVSRLDSTSGQFCRVPIPVPPPGIHLVPNNPGRISRPAKCTTNAAHPMSKRLCDCPHEPSRVDPQWNRSNPSSWPNTRPMRIHVSQKHIGLAISQHPSSKDVPGNSGVAS